MSKDTNCFILFCYVYYLVCFAKPLHKLFINYSAVPLYRYKLIFEVHRNEHCYVNCILKEQFYSPL